MQRIFIILFIISIAQPVYSQNVGFYAFARSPQLVNYTIDKNESTFSQGLSSGLGLTYQKLNLELGTFIMDGNSYGYYAFLGKKVHALELGHTIYLNTTVFDEVTHLPAQIEQSNATWIYTSGVSLYPNIQIQKLNVGIPLGFGLAYQDHVWYLNSRFILNLSYSLN